MALSLPFGHGPSSCCTAPPVLADVGPGSYDIGGGVSSCEAKPGYAPFLSTAERKFGPSIAANLPGPGDYSTEPCPTKAQSGKPSDVFRSATRRFQVQQPISETPGPGAYGGHEEFRDKGRSMSGNPKGNTDRIKWVRVPTAPSIPGREQSYGYEEGNQGELIMQRPADLGHSGKGDDRPGPVDYQPRIEFTRRSPAAIDFSKGEDRLVALSKTRASTTPGPGHYNATGGLGASDEGIDVGRAIYRKRQRPTASFHYGCKRDRPQKCKESLPGPGDYVVPSGLDVRRDPGRKDLSFLSTSRRFDELATHGNGGSRAPGPGSYVTAPSDFDRWRTLYRARQPPRPSSLNAPIGFQSTTLRFAGDLPKDQGLGPAAYNPGGMAEELSQKGSGKGGKSGAFGSTARRFPVKGSGQQNLPGPGSYELAVGPGGVAGDGDGRSRSGPSAVLGPAGKRLPSALSCFASGGITRSTRFLTIAAEVEHDGTRIASDKLNWAI